MAGRSGVGGAAASPSPPGRSGTEAGEGPAPIDPANAQTSPDELGRAVNACDFPLVVRDGQGIIRLANSQAAQLTGLPIDRLVGRPLEIFVEDRDFSRQLSANLGAGKVQAAQTNPDFVSPAGVVTPVWAYTRALVVGGVRLGVTLAVPKAEVGRLGRDPLRPWRELLPVAVGMADQSLRVQQVSTDIRDVLGKAPDQLLGRNLVSLVHPDDREPLEEAALDLSQAPVSLPDVRFDDGHGGWAGTCLLLSEVSIAGEETSGVLFALVGSVDQPAPQGDRAAQLEMHLRRIALEVRAAGVLDNIGSAEPVHHHPQLAALSTRQWEILSRIMNGQRVPAIAAELFLSPSTVRNHLVTIFRMFGVHSQSELVELLRNHR